MKNRAKSAEAKPVQATPPKAAKPKSKGKKAFKIVGITLASLVGFVLIVVGVACFLVFTPSRLTPIVQKVADKVITCPTEIGRVNLTLFKTFPDLGLRIDDVVVVNPVEGAPSDTVLRLHELDVAVDVKAFLDDKAIRVKGLTLADGKVCVYTSPDSISNFDIFPKGEEEDEEDESSLDLSSLDANIKAVTISNLSATYINCPSGMKANADGLDLKLKGTLLNGDINAAIETSLRSAFLTLGGESALHVSTSGLTLKADASKNGTGNELNGNAKLTTGPVDFGVSTVSITTDALDLNAKAVKTGEKWSSEAFLLNAVRPVFNLSGSTPIAIDGEKLDLALMGTSLLDKAIEGTPVLSVPGLSMMLNGEQWIDKRNVSIASSAKTNTSFKDFTFDGSKITIDDVQLAIQDGRLDLSDSTTTAIAAHITSNHWNVPKVLAMLPRSIRKSLPDMTIRRAGMDLDMTAAIHAGGKKGFGIDKADGGVKLDHVDMSLGDSMAFVTPKLAVTVKSPAKKSTNAFREFMQGTIAASSVDANLTALGTAAIKDLNGTCSISDFTDKKTSFSAHTHLAMSSLDADLDTIQGHLAASVIDALLTTEAGKPRYKASLTTDALNGHFGEVVKASTTAFAIDAQAIHDKTKKEILDQWNPTLNINLHTGHAELGMFPEPIEIPHIQFDFTPGKFHIDESTFRVGKSDFCLKGDVTNLDAYMAKTGLLTANLAFNSEYTDVNQIMDLVSGLGNKNENENEDEKASGATLGSAQPATAASAFTSPASPAPPAPDDIVKEDDPFMVPTGVDISLRTDIHHVGWNGFDFRNLGGRVTCQDGVLVMEELGFTSDAATMQLTAMYKSPRKNHLFMGLDFHLIDIDIPDLIALVPAVDTIVPMLKSFDGQAEFHLAGESYLKSNYDLKLSTLRGAAAIEGKDLVVVPSSTFDTIKKYLMTDKSTENRIDSLDVELSVFRDEVDVYPFRVRLGQYEAIVGGRHNINQDFDFDYHISVTDTPLPVRLGLNVSGTLDDIKFKLATPKYTNLFKPEKRGVIQARSLELKKTINESLKRSVWSDDKKAEMATPQ